MNPSTTEGVFDVRGTELVLFIAGGIVTVVVFAVAVWLYRASVREHRAQLDAERREREAKDAAGARDSAKDGAA